MTAESPIDSARGDGDTPLPETGKLPPGRRLIAATAPPLIAREPPRVVVVLGSL